MSILDVEKKAWPKNLGVCRGVDVISHGSYDLYIMYALLFDQRYICRSMKNEKYKKTLSDQQCSE